MTKTVPISLPYNSLEHFFIEEELLLTGYGGGLYHEAKVEVKNGRSCATQTLASQLVHDKDIFSIEDLLGKQRLLNALLAGWFHYSKLLLRLPFTQGGQWISNYVASVKREMGCCGKRKS